MKKKLSTIISCGICLTMAAVFTAGCAKQVTTGAGGDPETRPFVMAIGATDGNFSPFFATAQYDTQVTELTQISMLSADKNGNITYGKYEPTVVLDYTETMYDDKAGTQVSQSGGSMDGKTVYEFLIKNGIKFSDGEPLTIEDVLFNLYVYLDPVYFGSSTIYSTDIIGLDNYRNQDLSEEIDNDISAKFAGEAQQRISDIMYYLEHYPTSDGDKDPDYEKDLDRLRALYLEEVTTDWTSYYGTYKSYKEFNFNSNWEVYYYEEGLIGKVYLTDASGNKTAQKKDGKFLTTLDEKDEHDNPKTDLGIDMLAALSDNDLIEAAMTKYGCTREEAVDYVERDTAIDTVYKAKADSGPDQLLNIFYEGWAAGNELADKFAKEAMTAYYEQVRKDNDGLLVKNIKGISTRKTSEFNGVNLGETHDVLHVEINGVDPKAIWNMAFQVAPAHYYSGTYKGVDYTKIDIAKDQFGVCFGDSEFFDTVLGSTSKSKLPVGAGTYQASTANGGTTKNGDAFHNNKVTYYIRNNYFETVGADGAAQSGKTPISNAKIKYVRYREVEDASLMQTLKTGEVDYGQPSCTPDNIKSLSKGAKVKLGNQRPESAGYGYVGLNPKYIKHSEVREAIMRAMNISDTLIFYSTEYASELYRPISTTNWVYDQFEKIDKTYAKGLYYENVFNPNTIQETLKAYDWDFSSGVGKHPDGSTLKYTFTIAGGTEEHPAYLMFSNAAKILNKAGFDITVTTAADALKQLATGGLQVWAAAYTSPIDPDLYQLYHKDSKASSVKNWGYDSIKQNANGLYTTEKGILDDLSDLIMEAREITAQKDRAELYMQALDLIMDLKVQLPTYQRKDLVVYNRGLLDTKTLNMKASAYEGVLSRIWEVDYNKAN